MVSEDNLKFIRDRHAHISSDAKSMLKQFERYLADQDWQEVQAGV